MSHRVRRFSLLTALALLVASSVAAESPEPWSELALRDLRFVHDTLQANHPGPADAENPAFGDWLERGLAAASERATGATDLLEALGAVRFYVAGFADEHTTLEARYLPRRLRWPGFIAARRGGRYLVYTAASRTPVPLPPVGAEILRCDSVPVDDLLRQRVLAYYDGRVGLESMQIRYAPYLFVDGELPRNELPKSCTVSESGETKTYELTWLNASWGDVAPRMAEAAGGPTLAAGVYEFERTAWVAIPTFDVKDDEAVAGMRDTIAKMPGLRQAHLIVFDVRGNGGGSSQWGEELAESLYGRDYLTALECARAAPEPYAEWRVSHDNLDHLRLFVTQLAQRFGEGSQLYGIFSQLADDMERALAGGETFVTQQRSGGEPDCSGAAPPSPVEAQVVLLTDGYCAGACLDFADVLLAIPGVVHAGLPTSADSAYRDVRSVELPSKLATLTLAMEVTRNRLHGHNEPYVPAQVYDGDLGDTDRVREWLLKLFDEASGP